tara:strand:+ start:27749 stop:28738 length:990 start_codon:yes stop_codon:yes gene_type:complete
MAELKRIELELYVYEGILYDNKPSEPQYKINKKRIETHPNITIEIGELVRDYLEASFNDDYISFTKWVEVSVFYFDEADQPFTYSNPQITSYLAVNGYGYFEDGANPELERHALISSNNIYLPENTSGKIPIFKEDVGKVIIDSVTTEIIDNGNTNQKIQYLTIPANSSIIQVYATDDSTLKKTINVTNICEPKYTPYKLTFINKFGAFQDLYMFKKSAEKLEIKSDLFKRNTIANSTAAYTTSEGQRERYNVNGSSSITVNTGFVKEDMNQTIEQLFLSENVWIRYNNKTLPILPKTQSLEYKTVLNDKLINYTIDFDFAFDKINNVR